MYLAWMETAEISMHPESSDSVKGSGLKHINGLNKHGPIANACSKGFTAWVK